MALTQEQKNYIQKHADSHFFDAALNDWGGKWNGSFYNALMTAIQAADSDNFERFKKGFPELIEYRSWLQYNVPLGEYENVVREMRGL